MKAVPRRLLVLGGGSAGVEMAQVVRRLGGEVGARRGRRARLLAREPAPLGEALGEALRRDGIELVLGVHATGGAAATATSSSSTLDGRSRSCAATGCSWRPAGVRASRASAWRRSASTADPHGIPVDEHLRAGERLWAIGDVTGIWPLTHVGKYQGDVVAANILGEPRPANYDAVPRVTYTDPQAAAVGAAEAAFSATAPLSEVAEDRHLHPRLRRVQRVPDPAQRRRAPDRRLRARPGGGRVAAAGDAGDPRPRPARRAPRHHPAVPELLGDLRRRPQGAPRNAIAVARHVQPPRRERRPRTSRRDRTRRADRRRDRRQRRASGSRPPGAPGPRAPRSSSPAAIPSGSSRRRASVGAQRTAAFDANDPAALQAFFDGLPEPIDHVLVTAGGPHYGPLLEMDVDEAREASASTSVLALRRRPQRRAPRCDPAARCCSWAAPAAAGSAPGLGIVSAATAVLPPLTASLALELAPVRVNLIAAGLRRHPAVGIAPRRRPRRAARAAARDAPDRPRRRARPTSRRSPSTS